MTSDITHGAATDPDIKAIEEKKINYFCNPRFACFRFIALILICFTGFGKLN
jgi:hypothetical protein